MAGDAAGYFVGSESGFKDIIRLQTRENDQCRNLRIVRFLDFPDVVGGTKDVRPAVVGPHDLIQHLQGWYGCICRGGHYAHTTFANDVSDCLLRRQRSARFLQTACGQLQVTCSGKRVSNSDSANPDTT